MIHFGNQIFLIQILSFPLFFHQITSLTGTINNKNTSIITKVNKKNSNTTQFSSYSSLLEIDENDRYKLSAELGSRLFSYVGCFNDRREFRDINQKDYSVITKFNKTIATVELCVHLCGKDGYRYAGVQALDECYWYLTLKSKLWIYLNCGVNRAISEHFLLLKI
jgi:hypothetical protein